MFSRIGIIGAGAMGRGIAQLFASAGQQVWLYDSRPETIDQALQFYVSCGVAVPKSQHVDRHPPTTSAGATGPEVMKTMDGVETVPGRPVPAVETEQPPG